MSNFVFEKHKVFGWVIHRKQLQAGQTYLAEVPDDMRPADSENITFWVKGKITGQRDDGYITPERLPGHFSLERGTMPGGIYTFRCVEDSEWWCANWRANRGALPLLTPVRLASGEERTLPANTRMLLCFGTLQSPAGDLRPGAEIEIGENSVKLRSIDGPAYGLIFDKERA